MNVLEVGKGLSIESSILLITVSIKLARRFVLNRRRKEEKKRGGEESRGAGGWGVLWRWGEREIRYLSLHCHHQNDFCIKMGSDESHFNVS